MTGEVTEYLYKDRIATLDFAHLSDRGFEFFEYFFRYAIAFAFVPLTIGFCPISWWNWHTKKFDQDSTPQAQYRVKHLQLDGIDSLWRIALETRNANVGKQAMDMLVRLYQNVRLNVLFLPLYC